MSGWQGFAALTLYGASLWLLLRIDATRRRRRELDARRLERRARLMFRGEGS